MVAGVEDDDHLLALKPGTTLGEFEILSVLGHGGFGITYRAVDTNLQEEVAIKEYLPGEQATRASDSSVRAKTRDGGASFEKGLESFLEEARTIARFRHRNIMQVRRFFKQNGTGYIVLGYERGGTLSDLIKKGPIEAGRLRSIMLQLVDGLEVVHDRGILHRDLKPNNVIFREDGTPVLIDFGAARDFTERHSRSVTQIATAGYSPPEQYGAGGQPGPWSDFYALGAIGYRCVTGEPPVDSLKRLRRDPLVPAVEAAAGKYPEDLLRAIDWMMQVNEEDRPVSAEEARQGLKGAIPSAGGAPVGQRPLREVPLVIRSTGPRTFALAFDTETRADEIEVSLKAMPTGRYLSPGAGEGSWGAEPYLFALPRDPAADKPTFLVSGEFLKAVVPGTAVVASTADGHLLGTALWPEPVAAPVVAGGKGRKAALAALLLLFGGGALAANYSKGFRSAACGSVGMLCGTAAEVAEEPSPRPDAQVVAPGKGDREPTRPVVPVSVEAPGAPPAQPAQPPAPRTATAEDRQSLEEAKACAVRTPCEAAVCASGHVSRQPASLLSEQVAMMVSMASAQCEAQRAAAAAAAQPAPQPAYVPPLEPVRPRQVLADGLYPAERGYTGPKSRTDRFNCPPSTSFTVTVAGQVISFEGQEGVGAQQYTRYWRGTVDQVNGDLALRGSDAAPPTKNLFTVVGRYDNAVIDSFFCGPGFFRILPRG